jgi:hypothetical protein
MPARMEGRARSVQHWLGRRADTPVGQLALGWYRRYFESSQNSGSAATLYIFLSVAPMLLAALGLFHAAGRHHLAERIRNDRPSLPPLSRSADQGGCYAEHRPRQGVGSWEAHLDHLIARAGSYARLVPVREGLGKALVSR